MHAQIVRPFADASQRRHLQRGATVLALRLGLLSALALVSPKAALLYLLACADRDGGAHGVSFLTVM